MSEKLPVMILNKWWELFQHNQSRRFKILLSVFWITITLLNPNIYIFIMHVISTSSNLDNFSGLTAIGLAFPILFAFAAFLIPIACFNINNQVDHDINSDDFNNECLFNASCIKFQSKSPLHLLEHQPEIFIRPKRGVFRLTHIAGTNTHLIDNNTFNHGSIWVIASFLFTAAMFNSSLFLLDAPVSSTTFTINLVCVLLVLVVTNFITAIITHLKKMKVITQSALEEQKNPQRFYCEFSADVTRRNFDTSNDPYGVLVIENQRINNLTNTINGQHPKVAQVFEAIITLMDNNYATMMMINSLAPDKFTEVNSEKYLSYIGYLQKTSYSYVPAVIKEIVGSASSFSSKHIEINVDGDATTQMEAELVSAYDKLYTNIIEINTKVLLIASYYNKITATKVLGSIQELIEHQNSIKSLHGSIAYSNKTAVMDKSLNQEIIPELENLMIHADPERKVKIKQEIDRINLFFEKQVEIDRRNALQIRSDYDKAVTINSDNALAPTVNSIDQYLQGVDYYMKGLEDSW